MTAFTDDFNRADGPLGGNWVVNPGSASIVSGHCRLGSFTNAYPQDPTGSADYDVTITVSSPDAAYYIPVVYLRDQSPGSVGMVEIASTRAGGTYQMQLRVYTGSSWATIGTHTIVTESVESHTLRTLVTGTRVHFYIDGAVSPEYVLSYNGSGTGWFLNTGQPASLDSIARVPYVAQTLTITPDPLWVGGGACLVTATGNGTSWADGDPWSTVFSCDHGTVEPYRFVSATELQLLFTPADYLGPLVFTETQYGLSDTVNATIEPPESGTNGLCQLTPAGAEIINRAGLIYPDSQVLTTETVVESGGPGLPDVTVLTALSDLLSGFYVYHIPGMTLTLGRAIDKLWYAVNGRISLEESSYPNQPAQPINATLGDMLLAWYNENTADYYKVQDIIDAIDGISSPDLSAIRGDIGIEDNGTWTSLLQVLLGLWGPGADTVTTLGTRLDALVTLSGWNLGNVKTWIEAIPGSDLSAITNKLDLIQPTNSHSLDTLTSTLSSVQTVVNQISTSLGQMRTGGNYTLQTVLDAINAIEIPPGTTYDGAPVWPGTAGVTFGSPVALSPQLVLDGPMDGVVVDVTTPPGASGGYNVGGRALDYGQFRIAFESDHGELEPWQYFGFRQALYTPKSMARAAKARFQITAGTGGTVTPWTRS